MKHAPLLIGTIAVAISCGLVERLFPRAAQPVLREGFLTDLTYFFLNHVLAHALLFFTARPAALLLTWVRYEPLAQAIASQSAFVQVAEIVIVADLFQYGIHRLFHQVPLLWRVHAIHHSSTKLDWLAGSRLHLADILVVRAVTVIPLFAGGFSDDAIRGYAAIAALSGAFLHANVRFRFGVLEKLFTTPRYHAFHHAADADAVDRNFAFHLPIIDRIFGTQLLPPRSWPRRLGVHDRRVPSGWLGQLVYPVKRPTSA